MKKDVRRIPDSLRVLMSDAIDYAGLFPPAALDMHTAVANYARYRRGGYAWMLGRFVLPASRLIEFEQAMPHGEASPWPLSVLMGPKSEEDVAALEAFAPRCGQFAFIDCVETKVASVEDIEGAYRWRDPAVVSYYETPLTPELPALLDAIKRVGGRAKVRTGGVTPAAFPSSDEVVRFLIGCAKRELPFKATAGLHHPVRGVKPLSSEANAPKANMYGFLNLFVAAMIAMDGLPREITAALEENDPTVFGFEDLIMRWGECCLEIEGLIDTRQSFAISFGSCSFEEPIADLKALNLL
jgi:hypothetical protein